MRIIIALLISVLVGSAGLSCQDHNERSESPSVAPDANKGQVETAVSLPQQTPKMLTQSPEKEQKKTPPRPIQIASGSDHSCALFDDGTARCWGKNSECQIGVGHRKAVIGTGRVMGLEDGLELVAGYGRTCAKRRNGKLSCWGGAGMDRDDQEALKASSFWANRAIEVTGLSNVLSVGVGSSSAICAIDNSGRPDCWGGQAPKNMPSGTFSYTSGSVNQLCLLSDSGEVLCSGSAEDFSPVKGLRPAVQISVGRGQACAILKNSTVKCWEFSGEGKSQKAETVEGLSDVLKVRAGQHHACALVKGGTVKCWGTNWAGQLGQGNSKASETPVAVKNLDEVIDISTSDDQSCALRQNGDVLCWGNVVLAPVPHADPTHQMWRVATGGLNRTLFVHRVVSKEPVLVQGIDDAISVAGGAFHSCAVHRDGSVSCWGANNAGQLGQNDSLTRPTPVKVEGVSEAIDIVAGNFHNCVLHKNRTVSCWGGVGELFAPTKVNELDDVEKLVATPRSTCALRSDKTWWCWGPSTKGSSPAHDPNLDGALFYGQGAHIRYLLDKDGKVVKRTSRGETPIKGLKKALTLTVGTTHACAVQEEDRYAYCWEDRYDRIREFAKVPGGREMTEISAGEDFTCGVHKRGAVACWGLNNHGELGRNIGIYERDRAVNVYHVIGTRKLSAGMNHICAVRKTGTVRCWGDSTHGQVGDGRAAYRQLPTLMDFADHSADEEEPDSEQEPTE